MQYLSLALASGSRTSSRFIHGVAGSRLYFSSKAEYYSTVWIYSIFFVSSSVHRHLSHFNPLVIANTAAVSMDVQAPLPDSVFNSLVFTASSRIAGSCGNSRVFVLLFVLVLFVPGSSTQLSYQQYTKVPISPYPRQHL